MEDNSINIEENKKVFQVIKGRKIFGLFLTSKNDIIINYIPNKLGKLYEGKYFHFNPKYTEEEVLKRFNEIKNHLENNSDLNEKGNFVELNIASGNKLEKLQLRENIKLPNVVETLKKFIIYLFNDNEK